MPEIAKVDANKTVILTQDSDTNTRLILILLQDSDTNTNDFHRHR